MTETAITKAPETIVELKQYCTDNDVPVKSLRVRIGWNDPNPKCYGIYKDEETGEFVVYKNKSDGTRFEKYRGMDEKLAVDTLFEKVNSLMGIETVVNPYMPGTKEAEDFEKVQKFNGKVSRFAPFIAAVVFAFGGCRIPTLPFMEGKQAGYYLGRNDALVYRMPTGDMYTLNEDGWDRYYGLEAGLKYQDDYEPDPSVDFTRTWFYEHEMEKYREEQARRAEQDDYDDDWDSYDSGSSSDWDSDW